jgi:trigger factor
MKVKKEILPKSRVKLTIEVPAEKVEKYFSEAYKKLAPTVEIKGFRPGQAPRAMTLESIGYGRYHQTALDLALPETYYEAIITEKIVPVQPPAVSVKEFKEGAAFIYEAEVDVVPGIKLGDYKKIKIKYQKPKFEVKKEEIDKIITRLRYQSAIFNSVDRPAKNGDRVEIDFEGTVDKVKQDNLCSKNHPIILGEGTMIPGFEKELIGMKKDEEKEFNLEVPQIKDRSKTQKAHFKVKIIDVKEVILPEVNNDFAKKFGHDTPEKLEQAIQEKVLEEKVMQDRQLLEQKVLEKVIEESKIDVPESLVEQEVSRRLLQFQNQMGPGFPKYLESIGKKIEDLKKEMRASSEQSVKIGLILGEIAKNEEFFKPHKHDDHDHNHKHDHEAEQKDQQEAIKKTIDFLVESATK